MYSNGQTLMSKDKKRLVRIKPTSGAGVWAWEIAAFIDEDGNEFTDDIRNYTHVEDEFGRAYSRPVKKVNMLIYQPENILSVMKNFCK